MAMCFRGVVVSARVSVGNNVHIKRYSITFG